MNAKKIILISAVTTYCLHKKMQHDTIYRFPEIDRKIARKAYNRVLLNALTGSIPSGMTTEELDELFLRHVRTIDPFYDRH